MYNDDAAFAITYRFNSVVKTALVARSGFICRGWDFWFNMIPSEHMKSEADLRSYLGTVGLDKAAEWFDVKALRHGASAAPDSH